MFYMKCRTKVKHKYCWQNERAACSVATSISRDFVAKRKKQKLYRLLLFLKLPQYCVIDLCNLFIICIQNVLYMYQPPALLSVSLFLFPSFLPPFLPSFSCWSGWLEWWLSIYFCYTWHLWKKSEQNSSSPSARHLSLPLFQHVLMYSVNKQILGICNGFNAEKMYRINISSTNPSRTCYVFVK